MLLRSFCDYFRIKKCLTSHCRDKSMEPQVQCSDPDMKPSVRRFMPFMKARNFGHADCKNAIYHQAEWREQALRFTNLP